MQKRTIAACLHTIVLLLVLAAPFPAVSAASEFTVFWVEIDTSQANKHNSNSVSDLYINGGEEDSLNMSSVLDVYRKKTIWDENNGSEYEVSILVGQIKVVSLFEHVAVTRIISLTSPGDTPVLKYRTVMTGDYAVPVRYQETEGAKINDTFSRTDRGTRLIDSAVVFPSKILFALNGWDLRPEAKETISFVHDIFNKTKDKDILVEGYTCSLGPEKYNLELSRKRAQSVADYIRNTKHIPAADIHIEYYGEKFPVASNNVEEGRAKNRRVEIRFLPRKNSASSKPPAVPAS